MRIHRSWLIGGSAILGVYLIALLLFVASQASAQSRHILWNTGVNQWNCRLDIDQAGRVVAFGQYESLKVFSPDGRKLWSYKDPDNSSGMTAHAIANMADGSMLLLTDDDPFPNYGMPGQQWTAASKQEIVHLDKDGNVLATLTPGFRFNSAAGISVFGDLIVVADSSGKLRAIDMSGQQQWQSSVPAGLQRISWPLRGLLVLDVNTVSGKGDLSLVDEQGSLLWQFPLPGDYGNSLSVIGDRICYVDGIGELRCLNADGKELWKFQPLNADGSASAFPILGISSLQHFYPGMERPGTVQRGSNGGIALIDVSGRLFRLDENGQQLSAIDLELNYGSGAAIDLDRGRVVACDGGGLRIFDLAGKLLKSNAYIESSQVPLLDSNSGQAYVLDRGSLFCVEY